MQQHAVGNSSAGADSRPRCARCAGPATPGRSPPRACGVQRRRRGGSQSSDARPAASADVVDHGVEVVHRHPVDGDDAIPGGEPGARRGAVREHVAEHRGTGGQPEIEAETTEELRRLGQVAPLLGVRNAEVAVRVSPSLPRTPRSSSPPALMASSRPKIDIALAADRGAVRGCGSRPRTSGPRWPRASPSVTSPTLGRSSVTPLTHSMPHSRATANNRLKTGSGEQHGDALPGGPAREGARQLGAGTGPSRSSSIFT